MPLTFFQLMVKRQVYTEIVVVLPLHGVTSPMLTVECNNEMFRFCLALLESLSVWL